MSDPINDSQTDTYSLKGFVIIGSFADNGRHQTAPLGELSLLSATYATDRAVYATTAGSSGSPVPMALSVFSSKTVSERYYDVPTEYSDFLLRVIRWSQEQASAGAFGPTTESFRQRFMAEFDGYVLDAQVAEMVTHNGLWLPSNVSFYLLPAALGSAWTPEELADLERSRIKLWFADSAFRTQYDEFELEFVAPVATSRLDDFFQRAELVADMVAERTIPQMQTEIHLAKEGNPETKITAMTFQYHDPNDRTYRRDTNWNFIIWGAAGDNVDSLKAGLAEWILANSTHTRQEWAVIFPDIFTSTEFVITPGWSFFAIPNKTQLAGMHSPVVNAVAGMQMARRTSIGTAYTQAHIDKVLAITGIPYKSMSLLIVGGPENREGVNRFEEQFPDYLNVPTSSTDFSRMSKPTRDWIVLINRMLVVAEELTDFSDLPQDMTRVKRTNDAGEVFQYVVANHLNVQYLVASRRTVQQYFPPTNVDALQITSEGAVGVVAMPHADIRLGNYRTTFEAVGGKAPFEYELVSVSDTSKFANAMIDPNSGEFTGTPLIAGDIQVEVAVTDDSTTRASKVFTMHIFTSQAP